MTSDAPPTPDRRALLRAARSGATLGVVTLALPGAAAAASADTTSTTGTLRSFAIDDTVAPASGHDVALQVRLLDTTGLTFTGAATVTVTVTVDDGTADGAGSSPAGLRIDGEVRTTRTVAADAGLVTVSLDLPASGTYLVTVTTVPAATAQPDGVVVAIVFTAA